MYEVHGIALIFKNFDLMNVIAKFTTLAVDIHCWIYNINVTELYHLEFGVYILCYN